VDVGAWRAALEGKVPDGVSVKAAPGRDGSPQRTLLAKGAPPAAPAGVSWAHGEPQSDGLTEYTPLKGLGLDNAAIASAETAQGQQVHDWQVRLAFTPEGKQQFAELTGRLVNRKLAIVLDGRLLMAPVVMERINGGTAVVTLGRSGTLPSQEQEARRLAVALSVSPLPAPLIAESEKLIPPGP
jgi:preprotein translocase subunit SecD